MARSKGSKRRTVPAASTSSNEEASVDNAAAAVDTTVLAGAEDVVMSDVDHAVDTTASSSDSSRVIEISSDSLVGTIDIEEPLDQSLFEGLEDDGPHVNDQSKASLEGGSNDDSAVGTDGPSTDASFQSGDIPDGSVTAADVVANVSAADASAGVVMDDPNVATVVDKPSLFESVSLISEQVGRASARDGQSSVVDPVVVSTL